ncbi:MAG: glycosyl transferase family 1, partial [Alphaproteobacteria bacterium]|nr:glycosyl transferase family 1 [Alphaproteobacteria bacterium]
MGTVAFIWDNFGPMHVDRCEAVQRLLALEHTVVGIEAYGTSAEYDWVPEIGSGFKKLTVMGGAGRTRSLLYRTKAILHAIWGSNATHIFFCNYDRIEILLAATISRLSGRRCYVMGCSKFDDVNRILWREGLKSIFFLPYEGGIASGVRSIDYLRFLGLRKTQVVGEYNTLSIDRIRTAAGIAPAPEGMPFLERHFTIVARLVPKKNLSTALQAYSLYAKAVQDPRPLHLCGSGPLEGDLR